MGNVDYLLHDTKTQELINQLDEDYVQCDTCRKYKHKNLIFGNHKWGNIKECSLCILKREKDEENYNKKVKATMDEFYEKYEKDPNFLSN